MPPDGDDVAVAAAGELRDRQVDLAPQLVSDARAAGARET